MSTIHDVARSAGVSTATVSRVLSQSGRVAGETRRRVLDAVARLGYTPNIAARTLRTTRAGKLLVTVPDISNPFYSSVIHGAEEAARGAGYAVILGETRHDASLEHQYAAMLARREVDGLLFLGHRLTDSLAPLIRARERGAAVVNACECHHGLDVPSVHIDNRRASFEVIEHLVGLGHHRIGIVTGPMTSPLGPDRLDGARQAMVKHGLGDLLFVEHGDYSVQAGADAARRLLRHRPTALFCCSDEMAMGALSTCRDAGLRCPADISLVGFDDIRFARFFDPPLTTIAQPQPDIGRHAVRLLVQLMTDGEAEVRSLTLPHRLVIRESTAPAPSA